MVAGVSVVTEQTWGRGQELFVETVDEGDMHRTFVSIVGSGEIESSFSRRWHMCQQMSMIAKMMEMLKKVGFISCMYRYSEQRRQKRH